VTNYAKRRGLERATVVESRDCLRRILVGVLTGELSASPGQLARLEGAIAALDALLKGQGPTRD